MAFAFEFTENAGIAFFVTRAWHFLLGRQSARLEAVDDDTDPARVSVATLGRSGYASCRYRGVCSEFTEKLGFAFFVSQLCESSCDSAWVIYGSANEIAMASKRL